MEAHTLQALDGAAHVSASGDRLHLAIKEAATPCVEASLEFTLDGADALAAMIRDAVGRARMAQRMEQV